MEHGIRDLSVIQIDDRRAKLPGGSLTRLFEADESDDVKIKSYSGSEQYESDLLDSQRGSYRGPSPGNLL